MNYSSRHRCAASVWHCSLHSLAFEQVEARRVLTSIVDVLPSPDSHVSLESTELILAFSEEIDPSTVTNANLVVHGQQSGRLLVAHGEPAVDGTKVTRIISTSLFPGEVVQVAATDRIHSSTGDPLESPFVWQFRAKVEASRGLLVPSGDGLSNVDSAGAAIGDLDSDGDLDLFLANPGSNHVWLNDGTGNLSDSEQELGHYNSTAVALGDLDGDGDLDAFVTNRSEGAPPANRVWLNNGAAIFEESGQPIGTSESFDVALGDVDGDGDLDAFVANGFHGNANSDGNRVWLNDGVGQFSDSRQRLGVVASRGVALADVDGDGDLDAYVANYSYGGHSALGKDFDPARDRLWINNGSGKFSDDGPALSQAKNLQVSLVDVDGDRDVDAVLTGQGGTEIWINDGEGEFSGSGHRIGGRFGIAIEAGDVDGDGDLDIVVAQGGGEIAEPNDQELVATPTEILYNDGRGVFTIEPITVEGVPSSGVALGDLDGDGTLDIYVTNRERFLGDEMEDQLWLNFAAGDSNRDGRFDQEDVIIVLQAGKYLTKQPANWNEGDWNRDGVFDHLDLIAALTLGAYSPGE